MAKDVLERAQEVCVKLYTQKMLDKIVEILTFGYEKLDRENCKDFSLQ